VDDFGPPAVLSKKCVFMEVFFNFVTRFLCFLYVSQFNLSHSSLSCPIYIPRVLTGLSVHLIPPTLSLVPIFTYVASACVVPEKYRKEIDSKCFKFIWNNKPDKVKRNTVVGKLGNGVLK
jgi:hypothetical protein